MTETAIQRRIAEAFIEHCYFFFPDLPETQPPSKSASPPLTYTCTSPTGTSGPTSLQSYTKTSDSYSGGTSPYSSPVYPSAEAVKALEAAKQKENLPHPLADSALEEGVTVDMVEEKPSPRFNRNLSSPAPTEPQKSPRPVPPPVAPRTSSSNSLTPPPSPSTNRSHPSPAPRPRNVGSGSGNNILQAPPGDGKGGASETLDRFKTEEGGTPPR